MSSLPAHDARYKIYLAAAPEGAILVETVEITHPDLAAPIRLAKWPENITAEGIEYDSADFTLTVPKQATGSSTETTITLLVNGLDGEVYALLRRLDFSARETPAEVTTRTYLLEDLSTPVLDPVPVYELKRLDAGIESASLTLASRAFPNLKAGRYYSLEQFPTMISLDV